MYIELFQRHFPEIAEKETRILTLRGGVGNEAPDDEYAFVEGYCTDPDCDCRRVMLNVLSKSQGIVATISFGFDPGGSMPGPFLDPINPQGPYAEDLLQLTKDLVLSDPAYVARLERHYNMVKAKLRKPAEKQPWWKTKKRKRPKR